MNKPSKCKNCQWYGKPYWSIINPCDNCPMENDYKTIITIDGEPVFKEELTEEQIKKAMADKSIFEITIEEKDKEIERLNHECDTYLKIATKRKNIIDELERILFSNKMYGEKVFEKSGLSAEEFKQQHSYTLGSYDNSVNLLDKLKELKGKNNGEGKN